MGLKLTNYSTVSIAWWLTSSTHKAKTFLSALYLFFPIKSRSLLWFLSFFFIILRKFSFVFWHSFIFLFPRFSSSTRFSAFSFSYYSLSSSTVARKTKTKGKTKNNNNNKINKICFIFTKKLHVLANVCSFRIDGSLSLATSFTQIIIEIIFYFSCLLFLGHFIFFSSWHSSYFIILPDYIIIFIL